ncbi:heavy metal-binding domain-containing protein [bacterium 3DAC]|nr:heavy metal-binding domain-containing protein [bacterium 3DAC]
MIVTTTPTVEGRKIVKYLGVVCGETIVGTSIGRDILASLTDIFDGRSSEYEDVVRAARDAAMKKMIEEAQNMGANAVVGVDIDYESIGQSNMMMVSVSGTAVIVE